MSFFDGMPKKYEHFLVKKRYAKGESIIYREETNENVYTIDSGEVIVYMSDSNGGFSIIARYGPGEIFGELEIFCDGVMTSDVRAVSECRTTSLHKQYLFDWLQEDFNQTQKLLRHFAENMRKHGLMASKMSVLSVKQRVADTILSYHDLGLLHQLTKDKIAAEAKTPRRSINRAVAALKKSGCIDYTAKKFIITDADALKNIVGERFR